MSEQKRETVLRFRLPITDANEAFNRFFPKGQYALNRTTWRGKEPRSCAVTRLTGSYTPTAERQTGKPVFFDLEVTYRPKGWITYTANTRYDGWTAMMLDRMKDGTLLDGHGKPLPHGAQPVYLPYELYPDVDFNAIDFGEFVGESETKGVGRISYDDFMQQVKTWENFSASVQSIFMVARRQRPIVKLALTDLPLGSSGDAGTRVILVKKDAQNFEQLLLDNLMDVMSGFFEGRYSLVTLSNGEISFVQLSRAVIELRMGKVQGTLETVFDVFSSYVSPSMLEDLAKRLISVYDVDLTIVEGKESGFIVARTEGERDQAPVSSPMRNSP